MYAIEMASYQVSFRIDVGVQAIISPQKVERL
jgi:hypothetical protein